MFTIKEAAEQVGISSATLRAWERRYGIVEPGRSAGGYRLYSAGDVAVLTQMAALVNSGRPPRLAATEALAARPTTGWSGATVARDDTLIDHLLRAAAALDATAIGESLDALLGLGPFEAVIDTNVLPAMHDLGLAWADGRVSVAGEHLTANTLMRRLSSLYEEAGQDQQGPTVLIGLPPYGHHELGLLAFAVAARRAGLRTHYVGANLPVRDWQAAATAPEVGAVVLSASITEDVAPMLNVLAAVEESAPTVVRCVGGGQQHRAPDGVVQLGHLVAPAAQQLVAALAEASPQPDVDLAT